MISVLTKRPFALEKERDSIKDEKTIEIELNQLIEAFDNGDRGVATIINALRSPYKF